MLVDVLKLLPTSIFILEQPKTAPIPGSTAVREAPEKELAQFILWAKCKPPKRNSSLNDLCRAVAAKGLLFFSEMLHADGWRLAADAGCGWLPANGELLAAGS